MRPPEPSQEPAAYTGERLRQSLAHDLRVGKLGLHVDIVDSTAVVTGTVPTEGRRAAVAEVVSEFAPGLLRAPYRVLCFEDASGACDGNADLVAGGDGRRPRGSSR